MDEYKHEANFKRCLRQLTLEDVIEAVKRAKDIMKLNKENGYTLHQYKGYSYYRENPSLMIWEVIEKILVDCELIKKNNSDNVFWKDHVKSMVLFLYLKYKGRREPLWEQAESRSLQP